MARLSIDALAVPTRLVLQTLRLLEMQQMEATVVTKHDVMRETGLSRPTILRSLSELEKAGWISACRSSDPETGGHCLTRWTYLQEDEG